MIYLNDVANKNNEKVEDIVSDLSYRGGLKKLESKRWNTEYPDQTTKEEWLSILRAIEQDPQLINLPLEHGNVGNVYDKKGNIIDESEWKTLGSRRSYS